MKYFTITFFMSLLAMSFLVGGKSAFAASSALVLYTEETVIISDEYGEYEETQQTIVHNIVEGGTYPVDLEKEYGAYLTSEIATHFPIGFLYRINGEGMREFVSQVGGYDPLTWEEAGNYEIDFYDTEPPILGGNNLWNRLMDAFVATAHAQSPELFLETIHFRITDENAVAECCSSVLFLPGIKGSVLKTETNILWPPTLWSADVQQLALDENGNSKEEVFVDGMLSTFYGTPIYSTFGSFMNTLVDDGTIADWEPLPYDWRFGPKRILEEGVKTDDGVVDLITQIESVAAESYTGQVTIVAHSMGGLMGKAIIKKLEEEGKADLIDSFVMVGSPQLGTPQAIAAILHGHGESLLAGRLVDSRASRAIAQNMQSSYNLLPSARYFEEVTDPVVTFNENDWYTAGWAAEWGTSLNTYDEYQEFVTGEGVERDDPFLGDLSRPEILGTSFVQAADEFHDEYDNYDFPEHIRVVQVAGWGKPTISTISYRSRHLLLPTYEPIFTIEGDSTVVYQSAISSIVDENYFFNQNIRDEFDHKDLLSAQPIQSLISSVVREENIVEAQALTQLKPKVDEIGTNLLVSSHSPVLLGVYDQEGNYTGINTSHNSDLLISQEIPGSTFIEFGDSQYIFLPKEGTYSFTYKGTGNGSTTIEIETFSNDVRTPVVSYTDMPTTQSTRATFEVDSTALEDTEIELDKNGDGAIDTVVKADGTQVSLTDLIVLLKTTITGLNIPTLSKKSLLAKVILLEQLVTIQNQKLRVFSVNLNVSVLKLEIEFLRKNKKLSQQDAAALLEILNQIKTQI